MKKKNMDFIHKIEGCIILTSNTKKQKSVYRVILFKRKKVSVYSVSFYLKTTKKETEF